ncbi:MAG: hypothetical protein GEU68_09555 [Actinobacteria bacterium]|nr:hypothetical protein [Actinomycetota bacterium]
MWDFGLLKTTILWLLLSGLALVLRLNDAIQKPGFFRGALLKSLGVVAVVEFAAAFKSFPLWIEIPAQVLAVMCAMVGVVAERDPQHAPVRKLANGYLVVFGVSALIWSASQLIGNWSTLDPGTIVREFLLPIWLTASALLFVYGFAVVAAYQGVFVRMRIRNKHGPLLRQRFAMMLRANGRLGHLRLLSGIGAQRIARTEGFLQAWREVGVLRREARELRAEDDAALRQLVVNGGGIGADDTGQQLGQGEFEVSAASAIVTPLTTSLRLAVEQETLLESAAVESNRTKEDMEALHRRLTHSDTAFEWLGPIDTANLIRLLAHRARSPEEIEMMALPIVMLLAAFQPGPVEELVEKFDRLLMLTGEPANRAMNIADTLTSATQVSAATFNEMLDALIAFYQP